MVIVYDRVHDLKRPRRRRNNSFRDPVWCGEFLIEEVAKCSVPFE